MVSLTSIAQIPLEPPLVAVKYIVELMVAKSEGMLCPAPTLISST